MKDSTRLDSVSLPSFSAVYMEVLELRGLLLLLLLLFAIGIATVMAAAAALSHR